MKLNAINGTVHSPGYRKGKGHYGLRQSCIFDVTIPQLQTVTIQLNHVDLDDNDYLLVIHLSVVGLVLSYRKSTERVRVFMRLCWFAQFCVARVHYPNK